MYSIENYLYNTFFLIFTFKMFIWLIICSKHPSQRISDECFSSSMPRTDARHEYTRLVMSTRRPADLSLSIKFVMTRTLS